MKGTKSIFLSVVGDWEIKREISNVGFATGKSKFLLTTSHELLYKEKLDVKLYGTSQGLQGRKEYKYILDSEGRLAKYFVEPLGLRLFYYLEFSKDYNLATANHLCNQDLYEALYQFHSREKFTLTYNVKGPDKDYAIISEYSKCKDIK